jgi:uncharacterized membrane protein YphA (DoxX/SURF4 family)
VELIGSDDFNETWTIVPYEQTFFTSLNAEGKEAQVAHAAAFRRVGFQVLRHLFHFQLLVSSPENGQLAERSDMGPIIKYMGNKVQYTVGKGHYSTAQSQHNHSMSYRGRENPYAKGHNNGGNVNVNGNSNVPVNPFQPTYTPMQNHDVPHSIKRSSSFPLNMSSPLDTINSFIPSDNYYVKRFEAASDRADALLDANLSWAKPYVPSIGRFFIVATFLEDSLRICSQWKEQVYYLATFRHLYEWIVKLFLLLNVLGMVSGSLLVILRRQPLPATGTLTAIVLLQGIMYGLFFDASFFLRNVSVIGGLLLALSDSLIIDKRALSMPGLPMLETKDANKKYFLLAGRMMLLVLFTTFTMTIKWSFANSILILVGFFACVSIAIGYKTKFAASILTLLLTVHNCLTNHYWTYAYKDTRRDYLRYEFFQTLSIVGGLLLIVNTGAGELSIDEKKKKF